MEAFQRYYQSISEKLEAAFSQKEKIAKSAEWIADSIASEGWIYVFGTGHSHILAEEVFYRAGGLTRIVPILDPALMLHENATNSTAIERIEGYAKQLLSGFQFKTGDVLIVGSNSGINPVPIEMAQIAKSRGIKTICIGNLKHSESMLSRHSSGLKLYEICDLYLDNFGEMGDASVQLEQLTMKVGATSTVIGAAIIQAIMVQAAAILQKRGIPPEIFNSSNSEKGDQINQQIIQKYKSLVKGL